MQPSSDTRKTEREFMERDRCKNPAGNLSVSEHPWHPPPTHLQNLFPLFCSLQRIDPDSGSSDSGTLMTPPESPHGRRRGRNGRSLPISLGWKLLCESPPQNKIKISDLHFFSLLLCFVLLFFPFFFFGIGICLWDSWGFFHRRFTSTSSQPATDSSGDSFPHESAPFPQSDHQFHAQFKLI